MIMIPSNNHSIISVLCYVSFMICVSETATVHESLQRERRQLLWTNSTLYQQKPAKSVSDPPKIGFRSHFDVYHLYSTNTATQKRDLVLIPNQSLKFLNQDLNIGVTTPTPIKTINVGWAFQANFQLPWNRSQIPFDILEANSGYTGFSRKKREEGYESDAKLYHFYKYVEEMLNSYGHNGTSCVLFTLCRLGAEPLRADDGDNLLHELATFVFNPLNDLEDLPSPDATPYVQAFVHGQKLRDCSRKFHCTSISLIDMFTKLHDGS